jgi:hypothetical protein
MRDNRGSSERKISWLLQNPTLWKGLIDPYQPKQCLPQITSLALEIQKAGFYSPKTGVCDIRTGMIRLLKDPRCVS